MLELRYPKLELVELVARHEIELVGDPAQHREGAFREPFPAAAQTARQLGEELLDRVEEQIGATARGHAASSGAAATASRGARSRWRARATSPRRAGSASPRRRVPPPTPAARPCRGRVPGHPSAATAGGERAFHRPAPCPPARRDASAVRSPARAPSTS